MTLDAPIFSHRIQFVDPEIVVTDPEPYCVAYLRVKTAILVPKPDWVRPTVADLRGILGLDEAETGAEGLDEQSRELREQIGEPSIIAETDKVDLGTKSRQPNRRGCWFGQRGRSFAAMAEGEESSGGSAGDDLRNAMARVEGEFSLQTS